MHAAVRRRAGRADGSARRGEAQASLESQQRRFSHLLSVAASRQVDDDEQNRRARRRRRRGRSAFRFFARCRNYSASVVKSARARVTRVAKVIIRGVDTARRVDTRRGWCVVVGTVHTRSGHVCRRAHHGGSKACARTTVCNSAVLLHY